MTSKAPEEIMGLEFDWLVSDADGHVALFSTVGSGWAPKELLDDTDAHDRAIDAIAHAVPRTHALFAPQLADGLPNTWQLMAERGLFAFDSDPHGGPYRLVAAPAAPISVDEVPPPGNAVARHLALPNLRFSQLRESSPTQLQEGHRQIT